MQTSCGQVLYMGNLGKRALHEIGNGQLGHYEFYKTGLLQSRIYYPRSCQRSLMYIVSSSPPLISQKNNIPWDPKEGRLSSRLTRTP